MDTQLSRNFFPNSSLWWIIIKFRWLKYLCSSNISVIGSNHIIVMVNLKATYFPVIHCCYITNKKFRTTWQCTIIHDIPLIALYHTRSNILYRLWKYAKICFCAGFLFYIVGAFCLISRSNTQMTKDATWD